MLAFLHMPFPNRVACLSVIACVVLMGAVGLVFFRASVAAQPIEPKLSILPPDLRGWVPLSGNASETNQVITVMASSNLVNWQAIAVLHDDSFGFLDSAAPQVSQRFYRFASTPLTPTNDWKNQVSHPYDPFKAFGGAEQAWLKFVIPAADPTRVFYADAQRY